MACSDMNRHLYHNPSQQGPGTTEEGGQKNWKGQRSGSSEVKQHLLDMTGQKLQCSRAQQLVVSYPRQARQYSNMELGGYSKTLSLAQEPLAVDGLGRAFQFSSGVWSPREHAPVAGPTHMHRYMGSTNQTQWV